MLSRTLNRPYFRPQYTREETDAISIFVDKKIDKEAIKKFSKEFSRSYRGLIAKIGEMRKEKYYPKEKVQQCVLYEKRHRSYQNRSLL